MVCKSMRHRREKCSENSISGEAYTIRIKIMFWDERQRTGVIQENPLISNRLRSLLDIVNSAIRDYYHSPQIANANLFRPNKMCLHLFCFAYKLLLSETAHFCVYFCGWISSTSFGECMHHAATIILSVGRTRNTHNSSHSKQVWNCRAMYIFRSSDQSVVC